ncbi:MAG TPA: LysR family transcriptional regulator, partial [Lachnospiraceae bacterium]|nr:LysR family transcriptional regulator [Lachnospiraceae bacterium]
MTLLSYQVFQTVVKQGSFQKAAEMLNLTPSAVSHAVASMEKSLGFSLFVRSKNGISLTNYGAQLMPYINAVLNSEESLQQAVSALNGLQHGTVKVGCFSSVCTNWMADIIHRFQREHPAIAIEVYQGTYADVSYWIKNGVVDFGFLSVSSAGDLPIEPLCEDPLLCITSVHYQKEQPSEHMSIEEMKNQVFVSQMETTDADIVNYMKVNGLNVQSSYHVVDDLSTIAMVSEGFGICIMPEMV